ncbi:hypothetical protein JL720_4359 [Aureococcus anophagefferens]|nr:hypothetical protein JL720_4359 [Aureococcus anophagefferens]
MAAARAASCASLLLTLWASAQHNPPPPNYELARDHDNLKPLQEYLEYRWVDVAVGGENVRLRVGHGAALDGLYAEACAAVAAGDARCVGELRDYVEAELRRDPAVDGYQRLSVFNAAPGEYALVAQLRGIRNAHARGPLALRHAVLVATGPALDAVPRDRLTAETLGRYYENVTRAPGDLDVLFRYDARLASLAARDLGLASAWDLAACVRVGTAEENDVGHLAGCVSLSPHADDPASHEASALLRVGALLAQPLLVDALTKAAARRVRDGDDARGRRRRVGTGRAERLRGPRRAPFGRAQLRDPHRRQFREAAKQRSAPPSRTPRRARAAALLRGRLQRGLLGVGGAERRRGRFALDVATIGAVHAGVDFLRRAFPGRTVELLAGESCRNLERGAALSPTWAGGRQCDVVFVDGDHFFGPADCDLRLLSRFSRAGAAVFADDVRFDCEENAHAALCGGPLRAWNGTLRDGVIREAACDDEGFCAGFYVRADFAEPEAGSYRVSGLLAAGGLA